MEVNKMETIQSGDNQETGIRFMNSFQAKLLLVIILVTIIPLIILEGVSIYQTTENIKIGVKNNLSMVAADETLYLTTWKHERMEDMKTLAAMDTIQEMNDEKGTIVLKKYLEQWGLFEGLSAVTPQGMTEISTASQAVDISDRPYFQEAISGKEAISAPLISKRTGNVVISFAAPVQSSGKIVGVTLGTMPVTEIGVLLSNLELGKTGEAYLINQEGLAVTPLKYEQELKDSGKVEDSVLLKYKVDTYASQQVLAGNNGTGEYRNYLGQEVIGSYTWIPDLNLGLILEMGRAEALANVNQMLTASIIFSVIFIILLSLIVILVTRSITLPIRRLAKIADELALGNVRQQVDVRGKDEIGHLAKSIQRTIGYQTEMAETARQIAEGNLSVSVEPKSVNDELGECVYADDYPPARGAWPYRE